MSGRLQGPILLWISMALLMAIGAVVGGVVSFSANSATAGVSAELAASTRMLGGIYATARTQNILTGAQLAADEVIAKAARTNQNEAISDRLERRIGSRDGGFAVIINAAGDVIAAAGDAKAVADAKPLSEQSGALAEAGAIPNRFLHIGQRIYLLAEADATRGDYRVISGLPLNEHLARALQGTSRVGVALRIMPSDTAIDTDAANDNVFGTRVVLDSGAGSDLVADLTLTDAVLFAHHRRLRTQVIAIAVLAGLLSLVLVTGLVRHTVRRQMRQPLQAMRDAMRRAKEGDYSVPVDGLNGTLFGQIARSFNDMQVQIAERESRIVHHAQYDALTGLTNRSVVKERIKLAVAKAERTGGCVAALAIDISRFNEINGTLGHEVGDEVLKELARRLASNTRVTDTVARVGGDEFFVLLDDADAKLSQHMAEFLVASLESPIVVGKNKIRLKLHTGLALYPDHCESIDALRRMANIALMTAKHDKVKVVMYEAGQDEKHLRELAIIHDLPNAIKNNELYLQYQPKIDVETQRVTQVEALVRWRHPQLGFIPPDEFIALLERSGRINQLTNWVFKEAVKQCRAWGDAGYDLGVAINISAHDLNDVKLPERIKHLLHHYIVSPDRVSIEVTESAVIEDPENSVAVLKAFRKVGLKVALDDFGTGQTSLSLMKQMPLSEIKIDKSFVQNLRADSGDAIIVKSIIDLGHNMGLIATAEGVESNYCWNLLNSYGCDLIQGYLVSAPLTADELTQWYLRLQERHVNKLDYSFVQEAKA